MTAFVVLAVLVAIGIAYQHIGLHRDRRRFPPPGELVDVGGHRLHTRCLGRGSPAAVLESGIAASSLSWARVQPELARFTRVCCYDRAGLAWSEPASSPRTFDRIVADLSSLLAHVAPKERCILVGHSFGAFVVCAYAERHAPNVAGLVLVDPATEWLTSARERARLLRGGRMLSRVGAVLAHVGVVRACLALLTGGVPGAPRRFVKLFGPTAARTLERLVGEVRKLPAEVHPMVEALWCEPRCFRAMADHLTVLERDRESIARVRPPHEIPLIVISSRDQTARQLVEHQQLASASASGRHVVAVRSAHWIQFDEPELVVAAVRDLAGSANS